MDIIYGQRISCRRNIEEKKIEVDLRKLILLFNILLFQVNIKLPAKNQIPNLPIYGDSYEEDLKFKFGSQ